MRYMRWVLIPLGAFVGLSLCWYSLEAIRIVLGYDPVAPTPHTVAFVTALLLTFTAVMAFTGWVAARTTRTHRVLSGVLVGLGTVVIYEIVTTTQGLRAPVDSLYLAAHAVKILGGAVGGWFAERQQTPTAASTASV